MSVRIATLVGTVVAASAAVIGTAVIGGGVANASAEQDQQYLDALTQHNITINDTAGAIQDAHVTYNKLDDGEPVDEVANDLSAADPTLTRDDVAYEIGTAIRIYCPMDASLVQ